jgi:hypothetical protein
MSHPTPTLDKKKMRFLRGEMKKMRVATERKIERAAADVFNDAFLGYARCKKELHFGEHEYRCSLPEKHVGPHIDAGYGYEPDKSFAGMHDVEYTVMWFSDKRKQRRGNR